MNTKQQIFLSHATIDEPAARSLAAYLEGVLGCRVFLSQDISRGNKWRDEILAAITKCKVVLVLATANSIERYWVNFEIGAALACKKKLIIPVCAGGVTPSDLPDTLRDLQACIRENDADCLKMLQAIQPILGCTANFEKAAQSFPKDAILAGSKQSLPLHFRRDASVAEAVRALILDASNPKGELYVAGIANTVFCGPDGRFNKELQAGLAVGMKAKFIFLDPDSQATSRRGIWEHARIETRDVIIGCIKTAKQLQTKYPGQVQIRVAQEMAVFLCMNEKQMVYHPYLSSIPGHATQTIFGQQGDEMYGHAREHFEKLWGDRWVLLDVGNVLVAFNHRRISAGLAKYVDSSRRNSRLQSEIHSFIFDAAVGESRNAALDRGKQTIGWLHNEFQLTFKAKITEEEFRKVWCSIFSEPTPDASDCIRRLRELGIKVGICSNTNASHWEHLVRVCGELNHPEVTRFLSFEMKAVKSDKDFFKGITFRTGRPPEEHLLVDDLDVNINAARSAGMHAMRAHSLIHYEEIADYAREAYWLWT
jgi:FMN phosphatase YigB (HAD superfamily)